MLNYTKLDEKIDKYLGTNNLRPGPSHRLNNQNILNKNNSNLINKINNHQLKCCSSHQFKYFY